MWDKYYAFGESLTSSGSTVNNFRYVGNLGYYNEAALALQYLRARYYQPGTGRFVSVHRSGEEHNWYAYVANNPTNSVDPSGEPVALPIIIPIIIGGGIVVGVGGIYANLQLRCRAGRTATERYTPQRLQRDYPDRNPQWPMETQSSLTAVSDHLVHCVGHCYITAHWGACMSEWCAARWRGGDSPEELLADRIGQQGAQSGYTSTEDCFNWCAHYIPTMYDRLSKTYFWPGGYPPPVPPPGGGQQ